MNRDVTAAVLAGGESARFGTDKALFLWRGKLLIAHAVEALRPIVTELFVVAKEPEKFDFLRGEPGVRLIQDGRPGCNPFWGLLAALEALQTPWLFLCPCDAPLVRPALLNALFSVRGEAQAVVPVWAGHAQPLAALYHRTCLETARRIATEALNPSPRELLRSVRTHLMDEAEVKRSDPEGLSFLDADRVEDLQTLEPHAGTLHAR